MPHANPAPVLDRAAPPAPRGTSCAHCGLPVPRGLVRPGVEEQFCCQGCRTAREVIGAGGLDAYYRVRSASPSTPAPPRVSGRSHAEFDDPTFRGIHCRSGADGTSQIDLMLTGVHCAACVWLIERLPRLTPGVIEARLDMRRSCARVTWDDRVVPLSRIAAVLDSLGYAAQPARGVSRREARLAEDRRMLVRLGVAGACAGNVMLLAFALYAGLFDAMEPVYRHTFRWMSMGISLVSLAWPGRIFFQGAWASLRVRAVHLDVPIALGLGAGAVWGVVSTVRGVGEIYFDSLSVLVFVLLIGRLIQQRQQRRSCDALELLFSLTPSTARLVSPDAPAGAKDVPVESLRPGDTVEVLTGDSVPVDGVVTSGASSVDQSLLSGESRPVDVAVGDVVHAGSLNLVAPLYVSVIATGEETRVGRLMKLVEDGAQRRAPIVRLADRVAAWFVCTMLALAGATAFIWLLLDPSRAVDNAVALLIVTCPCALGLSTPLAITVMVGRAARRGILIKNGEAVQTLAGTGTLVLDKTGTVTQGGTALVRWVGPEHLKPMVASIESSSSHPIARALTRDCRTAALPLVAGQVRACSRGVEGVVQGRRVLVGSSHMVREATSSDALLREEQEFADAGLTPVLVAVDGRVVGIAGMGDPVRADSRDAIAKLAQIGWDVRILSGDHPRVVEGVARQLGVRHATGAATPEQKLAHVEALSSTGSVVMVGDGANDAAALAAASVGVAVHGGAEASLAAADVYLSRPGLTPLVELVGASRATLRAIRVALSVSIVYNAVAAALAITGLISPLVAAVLMPLSSLTVLTIVVRARSFRNGGAPCR